MKRIITLLLTLSLMSVSALTIVADDNVDGKELIDTTSPEVVLDREVLYIEQGEEIDFNKYISASDDSGEVRVMMMADSDINKVGEHTITFLVSDYSGNFTRETMKIIVFSEEGWQELRESITWKPGRSYELNENLEELMGEVNEEVLELARQFLGMPGTCDKVAQAFIDAYFGEGFKVTDWNQLEEVDMLDAKPGDIIFYTNGGLGMQHYATYLGGSTALQGNIYNTTKIGSVFMYKGSTPRFYRFKALMD